jgi:hypothetical protein
MRIARESAQERTLVSAELKRYPIANRKQAGFVKNQISEMEIVCAVHS